VNPPVVRLRLEIIAGQHDAAIVDREPRSQPVAEETTRTRDARPAPQRDLRAMATKTTVTRTIQGREVPPPGHYLIDPSHSSLQIIARHLMISKVRGRFEDFTGSIVIADDPAESRVEAVVQASSIDTGDRQRDDHLRSADFLDVEHHPEIRFRSTHVRPLPNDKWEVSGDLTIRGLTRPLVVEVEYCGTMTDPWDNVRIAFLATGEVNREDFDITWNQALETGGFLVGKGLRLECDVEAVRDTEPTDG
jgi:polyisoprenoid-binding protein YceI